MEFASFYGLKTLLQDLGMVYDGPIKPYLVIRLQFIFCLSINNNKAVINIANNLAQHDRTKHIEIDRHYIKEKLKYAFICMPFVKLENQLAVIFTKGVMTKAFYPTVYKLDTRDIMHQLKREC